jgi:hypothetical protein
LYDLVGEKVYNTILASVTTSVSDTYPGGPWTVLERERDGTTRVYLQVYRGSERQPCHLDASLGWYRNRAGMKWSGLSVAMNCNTSYGTYLAGAPATGVFEKIAEGVKTKGVETSTRRMNTFISSYETKFDEKKIVLNRPGQCVGFHAGEQVHAGVGHNGTICPLTNEIFCGRIILYLFFVPREVYHVVKFLPLFSTEFPWGLMEKGILDVQV